jgi:tetrahydromethanopterin S-methyltransferase subunit G
MATGEGLPDDLREWVETRADERGVDPETVLSRAVLVHREAERLAAADADAGPSALSARLDRLDDLDDEVRRVTDRLDALDDEVDDLIEDVRERVVQVKRETDAKAPADHDHPDLRERVAGAQDTVDQLDGQLTADLQEVRDRLDDLDERTGDLVDRTKTLARVAVDVRDDVRSLRSTAADRAAADELRRTANRNGDTTATCEACGETVRLGLLSRPRCPHCDASVSGLDPSSGFFGSARLRAGDRPALGGDAADSSEGER